jgi:hypothetical protein
VVPACCGGEDGGGRPRPLAAGACCIRGHRKKKSIRVLKRLVRLSLSCFVRLPCSSRVLKRRRGTGKTRSDGRGRVSTRRSAFLVGWAFAATGLLGRCKKQL